MTTNEILITNLDYKLFPIFKLTNNKTKLCKKNYIFCIFTSTWNVEKEWRGYEMQLLGLNFINPHSHA